MRFSEGNNGGSASKEIESVGIFGKSKDLANRLGTKPFDALSTELNGLLAAATVE